MTTGDAIDGLISLLVTNVAALNTNILTSGYELKLDGPLDAQPGMPADASTYRFIKHGDRAVVPPGLVVCFIPQSEKEVGREGPDISERRATIDILCYFTQYDDVDFVDMDLITRAREKIAESLRSIYNRKPNRVLTVTEGSFYDCSVNEAQFKYFAKMRNINQGVVAYGVQLTWTGLFYVLEDSTNG